MIQIGKVSAKATPVNIQAAKNLPKTMERSDKGKVINNSMVPLLRSSAHKRMEMAGTKNR